MTRADLIAKARAELNRAKGEITSPAEDRLISVADALMDVLTADSLAQPPAEAAPRPEPPHWQHRDPCAKVQAWDMNNVPCSCPKGWPRWFKGPAEPPVPSALEQQLATLADVTRQSADAWAAANRERDALRLRAEGAEASFASLRAVVTGLSRQLLPMFDALVELLSDYPEMAAEARTLSDQLTALRVSLGEPADRTTLDAPQPEAQS